MKPLSTIMRDDGFTIQELLVAIVAGSLLVAFSYSLYLFVVKIAEKDVHQREHRERAEAAVARITLDIARASTVLEVTDTLLALDSSVHSRVTYQVQQAVLYRNAVPIGPQEGERWHVSFHASSGDAITVTLKSHWLKDSTLVEAVAGVPESSRTRFQSTHDRE